mmetsp:Transcript_104729/g.254203  ORF Transcript_104729/g.254203 Transcript_104729/m.254203 type:complete len:164 (+) Transcript_104729:80-571(+)
MVYSADDFSLTRPEGQDREIHVTTCNWQILLVRRSLWDVLRGGDLRDAALPIFARADKGGRVLQAAEPCRATGARKTYWKTLMATMAGCCTPTMATDVQAMEQPTHDSQRLIRVQRTVSADIKPVADVLMGWRKVAGGIIKHGPAPRSSAEHAVGAALRAVRS